jgi:hypothetical protein
MPVSQRCPSSLHEKYMLTFLNYLYAQAYLKHAYVDTCKQTCMHIYLIAIMLPCMTP